MSTSGVGLESGWRTRRWLVGWLFYVVLLLMAGAYKDRENRLDAANHARWQTEINQRSAEGSAALHTLLLRLGQLSSTSNARSQLETELNSGEPFVSQKRGEYDEVSWTHPRYGALVEMTFYGERLAGYGANSGTAYLRKVLPEPARVSWNSVAESVRTAVAGAGFVVWLAGLLFVSRFALAAANAMLAAAMATGLALLVSPMYAVTTFGIFRNDSLVFALGMYLIAIAILARDRSSLAGGPSKPEFSLLTLMLVTTVIGGVLAFGPIGYFTLAMLVIGASLYALIPARSRESASLRALGVPASPR